MAEGLNNELIEQYGRLKEGRLGSKDFSLRAKMAVDIEAPNGMIKEILLEYGGKDERD